MTNVPPDSGLPVPLAVSPATSSQRPILERLWLLFRHDMSEVDGALPNQDGTYRAERLIHSFTDPTWEPWVITAGEHPVGFAIVRSLDQPQRIINSFFIVKPARRHGLGLALARAVVRSRPGPWQVAYQDANPAAERFWSAVATTFDPHWSHQHRAVPDRPNLPPDSWISFVVR